MDAKEAADVLDGIKKQFSLIHDEPEALNLAIAALRAQSEPSKESIALGSWLSAALDDDSVCFAMKQDIRNWFDAGMPAHPAPVQVPESVREGVRDWCDNRMADYTDQQYGKGQMKRLLESS